MYQIEKMIEAIVAQTTALCVALGIDPLPLPDDQQPLNNTVIEELTEPDA